MGRWESVMRGRRDRFWPTALITAAVTAVVLVPALRLWDASLGVPFEYSGDANSSAMIVKAALDHGWYWTNNNLGAPFTQHFIDWPFSNNVHMILMKVLGIGGASYPVVVNLYYLLGYFLVALAAVWVLLRLGISRPVAITIGVLYSFLPYHETRGETHLFLGAYYAVPVVCFLILRLLDDAPVLDLAWRRIATWTNAGVVGASILIGCFDPYYAVFTLLLLLLVFGIQVWDRANLSRLASTAIVGAVVVATLIINMAPNLAYEAKHGKNTAIAHTRVADSEAYGLKVASVLLPRENHRLPFLRHVTEEYSRETPYPSELGQSLGSVGAVGLVMLLALALTRLMGRRRREPGELAERLHQLSGLSVGVIALATVGGLSSIVALVYPEVRSWNRISVFLGFFVLYAVALMLDRLRSWSRLPMLVRRNWPAVLAMLLVVGVADQTSSPRSYAATRAEFHSDEVFVRAVERRIGKHAMVFQLPYNPYPEVAPPNKMAYYDEARGYLHSRTLRWSFGAMRGRHEADWQVPVVAGTVPDLVETVAALGFSGIYIDRFGYEKGRADPVEVQVARASDAKPVVSPNHRLVLYDIRALARRMRAKDPARVAEFRRHILRGTRNG